MSSSVCIRNISAVVVACWFGVMCGPLGAADQPATGTEGPGPAAVDRTLSPEEVQRLLEDLARPDRYEALRAEIARRGPAGWDALAAAFARAPTPGLRSTIHRLTWETFTDRARHNNLGFFGVQAFPIRHATDSRIPSGAAGYLIARVVPDTPAAESPLEPGDVIVAVNGRTFAKDVCRGALGRIARRHNPGTAVELEVLRGDERKTLTITLGQPPYDRRSRAGKVVTRARFDFLWLTRFRNQGLTEAERVALAERMCRSRGVLQSALEAFYRDMGRYPSTEEGLDALIRPPAGLSAEAGEHWRGLYLPADMLLDPWRRPYRYAYRGPVDDGEMPAPGRIFFYRAGLPSFPPYIQFWCAGPDGVDGTSDDIGRVGPVRGKPNP